MYKGKKDWRPVLEVPAKLCYEVTMSGRTMIEIRIPNKAFPEMSVRTLSDGTTVNYVNWKSFVVMPEQVFHKTDEVNVITDINQKANITLYCHFYSNNGGYCLDRNTQEVCDIFQIMSRISEYYI